MCEFELHHDFELFLTPGFCSKATINALVEEVQAVGGAVAFLSTPSIYFSLTDMEIRTKRFVVSLVQSVPQSRAHSISTVTDSHVQTRL